MAKFIALAAAFAVVIFAHPAAAKAACPANNHQQLYDMNERLIVPENRDLDEAVTFIKARMAACPDDYEGLGYMAIQMGNVIRLRQDPTKIHGDIDLGFTLVAKGSAVYKPNTPAFSVTAKNGQPASFFTIGHVSSTITDVYIPMMAQSARADNVHPSMAGLVKIDCPYPMNYTSRAQDEAKLWLRANKEFGRLWLNRQWTINRLSNLAAACGPLKPVFLLGVAEIENELVKDIELSIDTANRSAGFFTTLADRNKIEQLEAQRKKQAAVAAKAYEAFFATKFFENEELKYLSKGLTIRTDVSDYPSYRLEKLREIAGLPAK
ncbi:hypothetical protein ACFOWX_01095 [Sphingorhabdus arenilitoris]|uniref:Uncharacterized protein n=1 Tax=Sphingorhabdus arenilitoris TaxID=1490041 RepID=A0ABV8RF02_9SPHN